MAYAFKNLNEVERQDKPTENTTVMAFEAGLPKQIPAREFGGKGLVVDLRSYTPVAGESYADYTISDMNYDPIYEKITSGGSVVFIIKIGVVDYYINMFTMRLRKTGLRIYTVEHEDNVRIDITFKNGSYHTTKTASK